MKRLLIQFVRGYHRISVALTAARFPLVSWSGCRQIPSCSEYCVHSIECEGVARGLWHGFIRVLRCNSLFSRAW